MAPDAMHEINRQLGMLIAGQEGLRLDVAEIKTSSAMSDAKSDQSRRDMHQRLDKLGAQVSEVDTTASIIGARIETVENTIQKKVIPTVEKVTAWEQRGIGALAAVGLVSGTIGAVVASFWQEILAAITRTR